MPFLRPRPSHLDLYLSREILLTFLVSFLLFFMLFLVNQLLVMAEQILSKRVPPVEVGLLVLYSMPSVIALTSPFATLIACLLAANRLNADNEILAMEAHGLTKGQILRPFVFWGLVITVASFFVNDYLMPLGHLNFVRLLRSLVTRVPEIELSSYSVRDYRDVIIVTGKVEQGRVQDILLFDRTAENRLRTISARSAQLEELEDRPGVVSIQLIGNVMGIIPDPARAETFEYFRANRMVYNILLKDVVTDIYNPGPAEMTSRDVWSEIAKKKATLEDQRRTKDLTIQLLQRDLYQAYANMLDSQRDGPKAQSPLESPLASVLQRLQLELNTPVVDRNLIFWQLEFYQKFSIPLSCLLFSFVGFSLGLFNRKSGRIIGLGIGLIVSFFYWALLLGARRLSFMADFDPWPLMYFPNFVLVVTGLVLWYVLKFRT